MGLACSLKNYDNDEKEEVEVVEKKRNARSDLT